MHVITAHFYKFKFKKDMNKIVFIAMFIALIFSKQHKLQTTGLYFDQRTNFVVNGGFETPNRNGQWAISTIPNWSESSNQIETGLGTIYNPVWLGSGQILELDANRNSVVRQVVTLPAAGTYQLRFAHATRVGHQTTSNQFSVYWNSRLVRQFTVNDLLLHREVFNLTGVVGANTL
jgi:hypothetical protein